MADGWGRRSPSSGGRRRAAATRTARAVRSSSVSRRWRSRRSTGAGILDGTLARVADGYALGAPLFRSLGAEAREEALASLADLAAALERARDLGHGSLAVVRDQRDAARGVDRTASLAAAATVEGKLMLSLVLCYLPALMLLVVVPLFLTLLDGLFG
jgi:hypothetical protein